jgi:hypothetical protein
LVTGKIENQDAEAAGCRVAGGPENENTDDAADFIFAGVFGCRQGGWNWQQAGRIDIVTV